MLSSPHWPCRPTFLYRLSDEWVDETMMVFIVKLHDQYLKINSLLLMLPLILLLSLMVSPLLLLLTYIYLMFV